jgi:hypothetical protein
LTTALRYVKAVIILKGGMWKWDEEGKQTPLPLVRKRNIPTELPPLVGEI